MLLRKGEVDAIMLIPKRMGGPIANNNDKLKTASGLSSHHRFVFFNTSKTPLDDVNLRKALTYSVDRQAITKNVVPGEVPKGHLWLKDLWPETPDKYSYHYDMEKAKNYLKKSSYDGETLRFRGFPWTAYGEVASAMMAEWDKMGIDVEYKGVPWSTLWDSEILDNKADMVMFAGWPNYIDPDGQVVRFWSNYLPPNGFNVSRYQNKKYDELFKKARTTYNKEKRSKYYTQVQELLFEDCPAVFISQKTYQNNLYGTWLKNVNLVTGESVTWNIAQIRKVPSEVI